MPDSKSDHDACSPEDTEKRFRAMLRACCFLPPETEEEARVREELRVQLEKGQHGLNAEK